MPAFINSRQQSNMRRPASLAGFGAGTDTPTPSTNKTPFIYTTGAVAVAGNGQAVSPIIFSADSKFELWQFVGISSLDAATDFVPNNFKVLITDLSTGYQFANQPIQQAFLCSTARFPFELPDPIIFPPNATIQLAFTNLTGTDMLVEVGLVGYKVYNGA